MKRTFTTAGLAAVMGIFLISGAFADAAPGDNTNNSPSTSQPNDAGTPRTSEPTYDVSSSTGTHHRHHPRHHRHSSSMPNSSANTTAPTPGATTNP